jgi:hypothetical protein
MTDAMPDRSAYPTRVARLHDPEDRRWVQAFTPDQLIEMVWPMTLTAWAFKEGLAQEPRMQRHAVRVVRGVR